MDSDGEDSGKGSDEEEEDPDLQQGLGFEDEDERDVNADEDFDIDEVAPIASHPLITDLDHSDKNQKRLRKAQMWFAKVSWKCSSCERDHGLWLIIILCSSQDVFKDLNDDSDEDVELSKLAEAYEKKGAQIVGFKSNAELESKKNTVFKEKLETKKRKSNVENRPLEVVPAEPSECLRLHDDSIWSLPYFIFYPFGYVYREKEEEARCRSLGVGHTHGGV